MVEEESKWYEVTDFYSKQCQLTAMLNSLFRLEDVQSYKIQVPDFLGLGYWERIVINNQIEVVLTDLNFVDHMQISGKELDHSIKWGFCIGEPIDWTVEPTGKDLILHSGEMSVSSQCGIKEVGCYTASKQFTGLTIKMAPQFISELSFKLPHIHTSSFFLNVHNEFRKAVMTPSMFRIIEDMLNCHYQYDIRRIYLEGKVMELIAVCLDEMGKGTSQAINLSRTDIVALRRAKEILDHDLLTAPGIAVLARQVCLNEFKLKKGFKQLFGFSVHAYVIDRRLRQAYRLLDTGTMTITEAAMLSGFSKPSHFAQKFREKYGVVPSLYFRKKI